MLKCIAIDDEPLALRQLQGYIAKINFLKLEKAFTNAIEAQQYLAGNPIDLIFVDINMPDLSGVEFVRSLVSRPMIIFTTAYSEYAVEGFKLDAIDYLLKPYKEEKFDHLAGELRRVLGRQQPELEVRIARQTVHLPLKKIHYAMAQNHFVKVITDDGECRAAANFAQVQEQLMTQPDFLVCNRGVIINMSKVLRFDGECIEMLDGARLPVRQKDKKSLLAQFTQYQFRNMQRQM